MQYNDIKNQINNIRLRGFLQYYFCMNSMEKFFFAFFKNNTVKFDGIKFSSLLPVTAGTLEGP